MVEEVNSCEGEDWRVEVDGMCQQKMIGLGMYQGNNEYANGEENKQGWELIKAQ